MFSIAGYHILIFDITSKLYNPPENKAIYHQYPSSSVSLFSPGKSSRPSCQLEQLRHRFACVSVSYLDFYSRDLQEKSHLDADVFLAIPTPHGRLDDLVTRDKHVQMGDREQGKADTKEVENGLNEGPGNVSARTAIAGLFRNAILTHMPGRVRRHLWPAGGYCILPPRHNADRARARRISDPCSDSETVAEKQPVTPGPRRTK